MMVRRNTVLDNANAGIFVTWVSTGNQIVDNTVPGSRWVDLWDDEPTRTHTSWRDNIFHTASSPCIR